MIFSEELVRGTLIKRYKRFLADITLKNGDIITAHCPNTGTMLSCSAPGSPVALSTSDNPKRKYPHTLEMVKSGDTWIGVNTARTNKLVAEAIEKGQIKEFMNIDRIQAEVKTSEHTRLDLQLFHGETSTFVEVKNCSLSENNRAMFPDAVTTRGTKHLEELTRLTLEGKPSCIFFLVQRMDADHFSPATHIDPKYSLTLKRAIDAGVIALVYQAEVNPEGINVIRPLRLEV
jgi:sugar fermentation stimulation protein A